MQGGVRKHLLLVDPEGIELDFQRLIIVKDIISLVYILKFFVLIGCYIHTGSKLEPPSRPSFNWDDSQYKPYFDEVLPRNITSQLGKSAYLHCAIRELGDRTQDSENKDEFFTDKENDEKLIFDQDDNHLKEKVDRKIILSVLTIESVRLTDSGQYSCKPSYADFANVTVQVFKDVAAWYGHVQAIEKLIAWGSSPQAIDKKGQSILHCASKNDHFDEGRTALHIAASLGYTSVCEVLLSASTNSPLKIREKKGNTALHLAVMGNHHKTVQVLIQHGASVNSMNSRQQTPLHIAAEMGFSESAQALLIQGADFTISEKASGRTALYIAARGSFPAIVDMLIKADRSRQSRSYSIYSELSQKCSLERNISLDSTDTHKTYLTSESGEVTPNNLQHQLSRQQSEFSQFDLEAFNPLETIPSKIGHQNSINLNKKQIHNNNTKEMRDLLSLIAKHYLDVSDWKKLAKLWHFSEEHIQAIEHQYTGKTSFKEHGHRMMSIWLHGLPPQQNALKELLNSLKLIERKDIADRIRKKMADGDFTNSSTIKDGISKTILGTKITNLMSEELSEGLRFGQGVVQIVASVVDLNTANIMDSKKEICNVKFKEKNFDACLAKLEKKQSMIKSKHNPFKLKSFVD
ncbi:hypothetical protein RND71_043520 [Anisodus tanguticus]|uniref:Ankyrin repeat and death domain-containing protein 1A n=1 Tax=Anisodus tanguticus TaxID=243964 RepID=A0AAE1QQQ5_9SOLA|nr:hypothetical protein RND71_043520 [Anisodus tanguticus]